MQISNTQYSVSLYVGKVIDKSSLFLLFLFFVKTVNFLPFLVKVYIPLPCRSFGNLLHQDLHWCPLKFIEIDYSCCCGFVNVIKDNGLFMFVY